MSHTAQILFFTLFCSSSLMAQIPSDCITAIDICTKDRVEVFQESSSGTVLESLGEVCDLLPFAIDTESNAYWIRYEFITDGNFTFTIIAGSEGADLDFYVFQSPSNDCMNLNSLRCMLSGQNVGSDTDPACVGPTGLSDGSTDVFEGPGCQTGDDNFLAPLEVESGEVYYLLIKNFSETGINDFSIEHGGSALLSCETTSTFEAGLGADNILVTPNPFTDAINIRFVDAFSANNEVSIVDMYGHLVLEKTRLIEGELNLTDLSSGIYFLQITNKAGDVSTHKIIKL